MSKEYEEREKIKENIIESQVGRLSEEVRPFEVLFGVEDATIRNLAYHGDTLFRSFNGPAEAALSGVDIIDSESRFLLERLVKETKFRVVCIALMTLGGDDDKWKELFFCLTRGTSYYEAIISRRREREPYDHYLYFSNLHYWSGKDDAIKISQDRWRGREGSQGIQQSLPSSIGWHGALPIKIGNDDQESQQLSVNILGVELPMKVVNGKLLIKVGNVVVPIRIGKQNENDNYWSVSQYYPPTKENYGKVTNQHIGSTVNKWNIDRTKKVAKKGTGILSDEKFLDWLENALIPILEVVIANYQTFRTEVVWRKLLEIVKTVRHLRGSGLNVTPQLESLKNVEMRGISQELKEVYEKIDGFRVEIRKLINGLFFAKGIGAMSSSALVQQGPHFETGIDREGDRVLTMTELRELASDLLKQMDSEFSEV